MFSLTRHHKTRQLAYSYKTTNTASVGNSARTTYVLKTHANCSRSWVFLNLPHPVAWQFIRRSVGALNEVGT